jgi:hypothetical protein
VRIALDATYSAGSQLTGIGIYSLRLIHGLLRNTLRTNFSSAIAQNNFAVLVFLRRITFAAGFYNRPCRFSARISSMD